MEIIIMTALFGLLILAFVILNKRFDKNLHKIIAESTKTFVQRWAERTEKAKEAKIKFRTLLLDICDKESIHIELFNDYYHLNDVQVKYLQSGEKYLVDSRGKILNEHELAAGRYIFLKPEYDTPEKRIQRQLPKIQLRKEEDYTWILAHELGHHFTIQYMGLETEEAANHYIKTLAEKLLTKEERELLEIEIRVYSHIDDKENLV